MRSLRSLRRSTTRTVPSTAGPSSSLVMSSAMLPGWLRVVGGEALDGGDHGGDGALHVGGAAPVEHAVADLDPTFRKDSPSVFDFGGNVQDESECLVDKFHGCPAITRIAGKRLDARVFLRRTRHHGTTRHGIAAIGCVDRHMQQVAEDIDYDMAFMPFDLLAAVDPAFFARVLGLDALRVDHPVTRRCRATVVLAMECIQLIQRGFPYTAFVPSAEVIVNRLPGGKIVG
jgi:hypothetical protein